MIFVDSTVWIDALRGAETPQVNWLKANLGSTQIVIGDLVLTEVLQGVPESQAEVTEHHLLQFQIVELGGEKNAILAARHYRELRSKGYTIRKTIDLLIATWCLLNDAELLHNDRDFDPFEQHLGLQVIHS
ncbi:MAG: type II toxin-antitoxin system VapC family toxin [Methylophilaceae bacterium]